MEVYIPEGGDPDAAHLPSSLTAESVQEKNTLVPTWVIASILATLAAGIVFVSSGLQVESAVDSESASTIQTSRRLLERNILLMNALSGFYEASSPVTYEGFLTFTSKVLAGREGVAGIGWAPLVPSPRRQEFELWVSTQTQEPYSIFNMNMEGLRTPLQNESTFLPIAFMVPRVSNLGAIGLNIPSRDSPKAAIQKARAERRAIGTSPIRLAQEKTVQLGTVLYHPIFSKGASLSPGTAEGEEGFLGIVIAALRMDDTLIGTLDALAREGLEVSLSDVTELPLSMHGSVLSRARKSEFGWVVQERTSFPADQKRFLRHETFSFAGRSWTLTTFRPETFGLEKRLMESGVSFAVVFLALFLSGTARRQRFLRARERDRLVASQAYNATLKAEILKRTQFQKENEILAASVEESPDIVKIADHEKRIVQMNKAGRAFFRISDGRPLPSLQLGTFQTDESRKEFEEISLPAARNTGFWRGECTLLDGSGRPLRMSAVLVATRDDFGNVKHYALTLRDLSERVALQRKLETVLENAQSARGQAERTVRAKDEFLRVLSHELRSPLTPILGWVGLLKEGIKQPDELNRALEIIERNANTQLRLINDLLEMSRIVGGRLDLEGVPVDLRTILSEAMNNVQLTAKSKNIALALDDRATTHPTIMGDAARLTQAFWNLLSNAVKFTPAGGHVAVRLSVTGSLVRVEVEDDGVGIPPALLPDVFERFRQLDTSFKDAPGGAGIGLALVKAIVELHGGSVDVRSAGPSQGSTFSCLFPLSPLSDDFIRHDDLLQNQASSHILEGVRILVVEDAPDTLSVLLAAFTGQGTVVESASHFDRAFELLNGLDFDLIVSDLGLPLSDGLEFMRVLRSSAERRNSNTPALALTADPGTEASLLCRNAGYQAHLVKPCDIRALIHTAADLVQKSALNLEES
jgi:signal transduction histidine kinase/CHASE1-domain containing sensor protein